MPISVTLKYVTCRQTLLEKSKTSLFRKGKFTKKNVIGKRECSKVTFKSLQKLRTISDDRGIAETLSNFFVNIVPSLKISLILNYISKFKHPSIKVIKSRKKEEQTFTLRRFIYDIYCIAERK